MVFTHQLTVGTFDGGRIIRRLHAQHITGIFQQLGHAALAASYHRQFAADNRRQTVHRPASCAKLVKLSAGDP